MDSATLIAKAILRFTPDQAGALWIGILLVILVAGDFQRIFSRWNGLLLILLLPAVPLMDIMEWEGRLGDPATGWLLGFAFSALFAATAFVAASALYLAFRKSGVAAAGINLPNRGLRILLFVVVIINILVVMGRPGEDSGPYTSLGAQRWMETGTMPYGDPLLRGPDAPGFGAAATYGPLLYVAHMPFQLLLGPPWNSADMPPRHPDYVIPSEYATKLTCLAFQLLALYALIELGRRYANENTGLAIAIIYAGSPYVLGLGSDTALATGLPYISHIAPTAMVLLALLYLDRPVVSGLMLAGAVGVLFWPLFLFPVFFGWYVWQQRADTWRFLAGFAGAGAAIAIMVIYFTGSIGDQGPLDLLLTSTLEHQEGVGQLEYGGSKFSFWGNHPALAAFWQQPVIGDTSIFKPSFMLFAGLSALAFFLVRGKDRVQFALLIALVASAIQLWKTHAGGTYVEWYLPFLLIGIFCARPAVTPEPAVPRADQAGG
jgi:hypothetical protein